MLRPKRNSAGVVAFARVAARAVVAACLALSFFASLIPLRASADAGTMACCVGKAGHCNSGLTLKPEAKREAPKPEQLCGLKLRENGEREEITREATTREAITEDEFVAEDVETAGSDESATESSPSESTSALQSASLTKPCPEDCRAGTTGVVRQPRPREVALLASKSRGSLPTKANWQPRSPDTNSAASVTLKRTRPRGPPLAS